jgi:hypothetical protein
LASPGPKIERIPPDAHNRRSFAMQDLSPRLSLPFILPSQAQKHVTHNEALTRLDIATQLAVQAIGATTPPSAPEAGQVWALGPAPTGDWAGEGDRLAAFVNGSWLFVTPGEGWRALDLGDGRLYRRAGAGWKLLAPPLLDNLDGVGINASSDSTNRLAVSAAATLLTHEGAGHRLKINKATAGDTASLLFQTGFGGRAEMGTSGSDDFAVKVSADGAAWTTALSIEAASGLATGAAVQQAADDVTPGRLARADYAYGPGNLLGPVGQSAGLPTGAVIERGATADGDYVRLADGTQICRQTLTLDAPDTGLGALFAGAAETAWSYPVAFLTGTQPTLTGSATTSSDTWVATRAGDAATGHLRAMAATSQATAPEVTVTAIGRWA